MISRRVATAAALLLLAALFIFPGKMLETWCNEMDRDANAALDCLYGGRPAEALALVGQIRNTFDKHKRTAKLMLNHEDIDDMDASIRQADAALKLDEPVEAGVALASLITALDYIQKIEQFSWINLI